MAITDCAARKARHAAEVEHVVGDPAALALLPDGLRARFEHLARECSELNRANGVTVAALRGVTDRALGILRGGEESVTVYGRGGASRTAAFGRYAGSA